MDCRDASERLPWYLNGTLEASERDDVRAHLAACAECRRDLEDTRRAEALFDIHVARETLFALASGETVGPAEHAAAQAHLATCADCTEDLSLARQSVAAVDQASPRAGATGARHWALGVAASVAVAALAAGLVSSRLDSRRFDERVAALESEVARLRGDAAQAAELARQLETLRGLQKNIPVLELVPSARSARGATHSSGSAGPWDWDAPPPDPARRTLHIGGGPFAVISLLYDSPPRYDDYRLEVTGPAGAVIWTTEGLVRQPDGDFTALVPTANLATGPHTLRLAGRRGADWAPLGSYQLDVQP